MSIAPESTVSNNSSSTPAGCPVCGSPRPAGSPVASGRFPLWECSQCGLGFLFPQPSEAELAACYEEAYYGRNRKKFLAPVETGVALLTGLKWRKLRRLVRSGGRLLDVGCGRGTLLRRARAAGVEAYGIERPSSEAHSLPGIFYQDLGECRFPGEHFQLVVLWHVLEHLRDPMATLQEICRILEPGGWLSVAVPNYGGAQARAAAGGWFHLDLPRHLWHFPQSSLRLLLENSGFRPVRCSTFSLEYDWYGTLQSWMNRAFGDDNGLYAVLQGQSRRPATDQFRRVLTAALFALPALASALWDGMRHQGGTLTMLAQKAGRETEEAEGTAGAERRKR